MGLVILHGMKAINLKRKSWKEVLKEQTPLLLPVAHNALAARMIERVGFKAYQVGGFALAGAMHAVPDVDLEQFGEKSKAIEDIISASPLPVMIDGDDGYGDAKNITRTVQSYIKMGVSALFIEDQLPPKRCGHMSGQKVIPAEQMQNKIRAAVAARQHADLFLLARTDAIGAEGLDDALRRADQYLKAGADGVYLEGAKNERQIRKIGEHFKGVPLAISVLEGGGETPWLSPEEFGDLGFSMILYPTTVLFQVTKTMERALENLKKGKPMSDKDSVTMKQFEDIVEMDYWSSIEKKFSPSSAKDEK
jgi:2-methylisocitrate lyase-like PEP mutase family enzyme